MRKVLIVGSALLFCACGGNTYEPLPQRDTRAEGYVYVAENSFMVDDSVWFPLMINYGAEVASEADSMWLKPMKHYGAGTVEEHLATVADWGFNAVRLCADHLDYDEVGTQFGLAVRRTAQVADSLGLKIMLLLKTPWTDEQMARTAEVLDALADCSAVWAYDFVNEPLYFDPEPQRSKRSVATLANKWRHLVEQHAPHQLFTIGLAEPIEVFEWDPALLPVDFINIHTYHPLRVGSEMWWYAHYPRRPWMVGEVGLPADGDSVPYAWQSTFMVETYRRALALGAMGYGWWEFQDFPNGVNFEAQYTGLRRSDGTPKPAASVVRTLRSLDPDSVAEPPVNYYNILGYSHVAIRGRVVDPHGEPIEGAVVRGWNDDWSIGMNTFTDENGAFALVCNDLCVHFEVSAAGYSRAKFDAHPTFTRPYTDLNTTLTRLIEYQSIDYRWFLTSDSSMLTFNELKFNTADFDASLPDIKLKRLAKL